MVSCLSSCMRSVREVRVLPTRPDLQAPARAQGSLDTIAEGVDHLTMSTAANHRTRCGLLPSISSVTGWWQTLALHRLARQPDLTNPQKVRFAKWFEARMETLQDSPATEKNIRESAFLKAARSRLNVPPNYQIAKYVYGRG